MIKSGTVPVAESEQFLFSAGIVKNNLFFEKKMSGFGHKLDTIMDYYGINKTEYGS